MRNNHPDEGKTWQNKLRLLSFSVNKTVTPHSQVYSQVYVKTILLVRLLPTEGTRGERQHRGEATHWACMATAEMIKQYYFCTVSKISKTPEIGVVREIEVLEKLQRAGRIPLYVELLNSLPESSKSKLISFLCQREIQLPHSISRNSYNHLAMFDGW